MAAPVTGHSSRDIEQYPQAGWAENEISRHLRKIRNWLGAYRPDLPGPGIAAKTLDEAKELIREATDFHLQGTRGHGYPIPVPSATTEYITV